MLSMMQVKVQHCFYQFFPPLATHALRPYLTTFPPPWQPMLPMIQVQIQHSFYQNFSTPLATHAVRPYMTTFLLSNFLPPLATHALRPYLTTFPFPWQPMLSMIQVQVQHSFYQNFSPPLATHAFNDSS